MPQIANGGHNRVRTVGWDVVAAIRDHDLTALCREARQADLQVIDPSFLIFPLIWFAEHGFQAGVDGAARSENQKRLVADMTRRSGLLSAHLDVLELRMTVGLPCPVQYRLRRNVPALTSWPG